MNVENKKPQLVLISLCFLLVAQEALGFLLLLPWLYSAIVNANPVELGVSINSVLLELALLMVL